MSLSVLRHVDVGNDERAAYLKQAAARRRTNGDEAETEVAEPEEATADVTQADMILGAERIRELEEAEEILLTVTDAGFGKRSSAYEYRVSGPRRAGDCQHHIGAA